MKARALSKVLSDRRKLAEIASAAAERKQAQAFAIPEISDAQKNYVNELYSNLQKGLSTDANNVQKAYLKYTKALNKHGFSENDFKSNPICPKCGDTGFIGGKMCPCIKKEYIKELGAACDIAIDKKPSFDISLLPTERTNGLDDIYRKMHEYVKTYPAVNRHNLLFFGKTGTGKSYLAAQMCKQSILLGKSAKLMSAYDFNALMLRCHTSPAAQMDSILHDVLKCDLLVIDDLGTEPKIRNVTNEYLLLVLEERGRNKRSTLLTTNLSPNDILNFYNERIFSRLVDKRNSLIIEFSGTDLRKI